ncbi:hypothetical protein D9758_002848 [Tetrapyrgos nigripes]|uniref:Uncharacterized protein n=1 Tax=Tetrapyrgos nigripes TaxID=182062 RepID=A0A8H5GQQ0_9AGAR|nr:hypothetical protein D9758_002848 [Tetrapyrgos nigripes]
MLIVSTSLDMVCWEVESEVDRTAELTEAVWNRIREPLLMKLRSRLVYCRNKARQDTLLSHYIALHKADPNPDLFPSRATFFDLPIVNSLWEKNKHNFGTDPGPVERDLDLGFDEAAWNTNLDAIKESIADYEAEMEELARERLVAAYTEQGLEVPADPIHDPRCVSLYTPRFSV